MVMRAHLRKTEVLKAIIDYLAEHGKGTAREISEGTGIDMEDVVNTLKKQNGWLVKCKREGSSTSPKTWRLV